MSDLAAVLAILCLSIVTVVVCGAEPGWIGIIGTGRLSSGIPPAHFRR